MDYDRNILDQLEKALTDNPNGVDRLTVKDSDGTRTIARYQLKALVKQVSRNNPNLYVYAVKNPMNDVRYFTQYTADGIYSDHPIVGVYNSGAYIPLQFIPNGLSDIESYLDITGQEK